MKHGNFPVTTGKPVRIQKVLSVAGIASRRRCEVLVREGRIRVNGQTVCEMGLKVTPDDRIEVDGQVIPREVKHTCLLYHKPRGLITSRHDPHHPETIYRDLPEEAQGLFHVGRLDKDSEGLLLLTNDGELAQYLAHPSNHVWKTYEVQLDSNLALRDRTSIEEGIELDDENIRPMPIIKIVSKNHTVILKTAEGKKRQIRRVFQFLGYHVRRLKRIQIGTLKLGDIPVRHWRYLEDEEIKKLKMNYGL